MSFQMLSNVIATHLAIKEENKEEIVEEQMLYHLYLWQYISIY